MTERNYQEFDFEKVGKATPFTVPENFFAQLDADIIDRVAAGNRIKTRKRTVWTLITGASMAAAATVALFISVNSPIKTPVLRENISIEQAFNDLTANDQEFLIETYRTDMLDEY